MKFLPHSLALAAVLLLAPMAAALADPALADPVSATAMPDPVPRMCRDPDARLAGMLAYSEVKLNLTAAQKPAWKKLGDTLATAREPVKKACAELDGKPAPTALPDRIERMQRITEARLQSMRTALPAIRDFYGQLSPEQKKTADEMGMMGGRMGHRHG